MRDMILLLSFESGFANNVARLLRGEHVYCKLVPRNVTLEQVQRENPSGLILAGGVNSRGESRRECEELDKSLLRGELPVLALGSAARTLCDAEGGAQRENLIEKRAVTVTYGQSPLFAGIEAGERWLEHSHDLELPAGYESVAMAEDSVVGFAHKERPLYGLQFQVEKNDPDGVAMLRNFALGICKCPAWWEESAFIVRVKEELQRAIGDGRAICVVSGGLDSTVCALLAEKTVADRVHCVLVDTGLMREGEPGWVVEQMKQLGLRVHQADARDRMADALKGATNAVGKRAAVQRVIAETVEAEARRVGRVTVLLRGTNYSDIVQAAGQDDESGCGASRTELTVVEPLRDLFRGEVYRVGELLGLPLPLLQRQPFPDGGLAMRVFGEVTLERLDTLRAADAIFGAEVEQSGLARKLWKYYATLAQMPDGETAGQVVILRAVQQSELTANPARLPYDLLERVVGRVQREVSGICRVVYDMTAAMNMRNEL